MFHRSVAALGLATALLCPPAPAAPGPAGLTFEEALALARQRAPALLDATGQVAEAQGPLAGATPLLRANPTLELEAGPRRLSTGERAPQVVLGLSQPLELGGQRGARLGAARAGLERQRALERDTQRRVLGEVAATFLRALHARQRLALVRGMEEAAQDTVRATQRRFEAGDVPVVDVNVARVALARARAEVTSTEGEQEALLGELRGALGLEAESHLTVEGDLSALAARPVEAAPPERSDITALGAEVEEARAERRLAEGSRWPTLSVGLRYAHEGDETALLGGLGVTLPLFDRGQGARTTTEAHLQRLQTALGAARRARDVQVGAALVQYRKEREALEELTREALPLLADNEELARQSYAAGEMGLAEFLLVRRDVLDARADHLQRQLSAALARVRLCLQLGVLP